MRRRKSGDARKKKQCKRGGDRNSFHGDPPKVDFDKFSLQSAPDQFGSMAMKLV
ncbi:hypothetical protein BCAR13_280015 [Paraburkholderia caribensis]|jgi:hypothetical protein|nr:hypothetical protein BCAR13_280015 [Paraburkholderia caribensis]